MSALRDPECLAADRLAPRLPPRGLTVLLAITSLQLGGSERQLCLLAEALVRRGCDVSVFALDGTGPLLDTLTQAGVRVYAGGYRAVSGRRGKLWGLARAGFRMVAAMRRRRPAVVHAFLPLPAFMACIAARFSGAPVVITARRALGEHQDRHRWWRPFDRTAARLSHAVTANSRAVAQDAVRRDRVKPDRVHVIYNAIDVEHFGPICKGRDAMRRSLGLARDHIAIACVANLIPYKGHLELIEAFGQASLKAPRARLFLIGRDDGIQAQLSLRVRLLGLDHRVSFLGFRDDVSELLNAMDIGTLASHEEGFPNALMEMLAVGLPVVATSVGGVPELLDGMPGCTTVPGREAEPLSEALQHAIADLDRLRQSAEHRRERVRQRYTIDAMVDAHVALYSSLVPSEANSELP